MGLTVADVIGVTACFRGCKDNFRKAHLCWGKARGTYRECGLYGPRQSGRLTGGRASTKGVST